MTQRGFRRRADEERVKQARAEEALRLRDEFLAMASHELRTPLAALKIELDRLSERVPAMDGKTARAVERAARGAQRMDQLVESFFDVSGMATGRLTLVRQEMDLGEMVRIQGAELEAAAARAECELSLRIEPGAGATGCWDRLRLEQVVRNVFANAIKYGAGAPVSVSVEVDGPGIEAVLEIEDRGPGIAVEDLPRIFDRYERAAPSRHFGGLGLGLYVSRLIVEAHGGSITARNRPGSGACFTVRLPLRHAAEPPPLGGSGGVS